MHVQLRSFRGAALLAAGLALMAAPASAEVFTLVQDGGGTGDNFLLDASPTIITGHTTVTGVMNGGWPPFAIVAHSTTDDLFVTGAGGHAFISPADGFLQRITITSTGASFSCLTMNARSGSGILNVTVTSTLGGSQTFSPAFDPLTPGENWFTVCVDGGAIDSVLLTAEPEGFLDLRQIRPFEGGPAVVPEPGSIALLGVGAAMGLIHLKRRRRV